MGRQNPDWLPKDWKVVVKVRSYGRKDKYYINTSNGRRFYSKPEVLRYLESSAKKPKSKKLDKIDIKRTAAETLPPGWIKETRTKKKHGKTRSDKFYIDPDTGRYFNSLLQVSRYLETKDSGKPEPEPEPEPELEPECKPDEKDHMTAELEFHSQFIDIKKTAAENLPSGWIKEIRTKTKGGKTRIDKFYIEPDTGRCFNSLVQVFRYLETKDSGEPESKPDDKSQRRAELEDYSQSTSAEAKGRRSNYKTADKRVTRRESAKSELELAGFSKGDTVNNAKQKDEEDGSLAIKLPNKPQTVNRVESRAKRMRGNNEVTENKLNEGVHGDQISKSGSKVDALKKVDMEPNYEEQREEKDESLAIELPNKLPKANGKKCGKGISQSKRLANNIIKNKVRGDQSLQQVGSRSVVAVKDTDEPKANGSDQREEESIVRANKRKNTNSKCMSDISRRSSKRHAQVDVGPSLEVAENNGQAMILGMSDINSPVEFGNYNKSSEHPTTKFQTGNKQKEHMTSSNGDLSCIQDNKNVLVEIKEDKKELDSSLNDLLMDDPCIEFAIKTLTGAFPIENVNNVGENPPMSSSMASSSKQTSASASSSVLPCDDIWADPCFEFAVKTLTGEMPKEDNNVSNTELSFHQAFNSLGATAKLDGGYLSDYTFSQFEAEKKLSAKQQGVRDPPLPHHAVNGSLGDLVGQQPSPRR